MLERYLNFGNILSEKRMSKQALHMDSGPKKRGRPLLTWVSVVNDDLEASQSNDDLQPKHLAQNDEESRPQI